MQKEKCASEVGRVVTQRGLIRVDMPGAEHFYSIDDGVLVSRGCHAYSSGDLREMPQGESEAARLLVCAWNEQAAELNTAFKDRIQRAF